MSTVTFHVIGLAGLIITMSKTKNNQNYTIRNKVRLIKGGIEYFTLLMEIINAAIHSIHLQIYIFDDDETGSRIGNCLIQAAQRNVKVYFMADGYGSQSISSVFIRRLKDAEIHFQYFEPFFKGRHFYFGRRLHHKVVVVDGKYALVGGLNITNRYNDMPGIPAWLDYAIHVQGEAAVQLFEICSVMWKSSRVKMIELPADINLFFKSIPADEYNSVRVRRNDWIKNKNEIWRSYFELFNHAEKSITIMCSYFLPGMILLKSLTRAAKRGVEIKIILGSTSDVMISKYAERYLYARLMENNITVYEYQPYILHAKLAAVDGHWVTLGSYNVNNISALASIETNLDVRNKAFANNVEQLLEQIIQKACIYITPQNYKLASSGLNRFRQKFSYFLIQLVVKLFTFYFKRERMIP